MSFKENILIVMSGGTRNFPSFGIRGKPRVAREDAAESSSNSLQTIDLENYKQDNPGEMIINSKDEMIYYNSGEHWIPLATYDEDVCAVTELVNKLIVQDVNGTNLAIDKGNLRLQAGKAKTGGDLYLSSGKGTMNSGRVFLNVGEDTVVKVTNKNVAITGDIVFNEPTFGVSGPIPDTTITADGTELPTVNLNAKTFILSIKLNLTPGQTLSGVVENKCVKDDSWVSVTPVTDNTAVPFVWLNPQDGGINYNIRSLDGELSWVQLHCEVRNSS